MGRPASSCCLKQKLRKGLWSPEEDEKLFNYITRFGVGCWSSVPKLAGLQRCGKSCRLRWINYLRPDLKRGMFSQQEEDLIIRLHEVLGNRWAQMAAQLPGRTDNEIKNFWNSSLKKKLIKQGIDPTTHKPISEVQVQEDKNNKPSLNTFQSKNFTNTVQEPTILITNGLPTEIARENFVGNKQAYDPISYFEFDQSSAYNSCLSNLAPFDMDQIATTTSEFAFTSMPSLTSFDHGTDFSNNSASRISSSNSLNMSNAANFFWDIAESAIFQFPSVNGVKVEELATSAWEDNQGQFYTPNNNVVNYNSYTSTTSFSEDLVFHQI